MDGGGGGGGQQSQPATNTSYNVALQPELMPYATDIAGKSQTLSNANYTPFQGQRIAGFSPLQQQAQSNVANMQSAGQIDAGTGMATMGGIGSLGAGQQYNQMATNPGAVGQFMSPYMQNAVDWQKQQAINDYGRQLPGMNAAATRAGAFGGTRQAVVESEGQRNLQNQLGGIQAQGTQNAYNDAMKSMQFGAQTGLQGYNQANQAAGTLGQLGQTQFGQNMGINQAQQQAGQQQQSLQQQGLTQNYQDFLKQQEYPYSQLSFYNSMIRGLSPVMPTTTQTYTSAPSGASQLASLGLGAYGLSGLFGGKAEGGEIKSYAEGGGIVGLSEGGVAEAAARRQALQNALQLPPETLRLSLKGRGPVDPLTAMLALKELETRVALNGQQAQAQAAEPSVMERMLQQQQSGVDMLAQGPEVPEGGIVPMAEGGEVQHFQVGEVPGYTPEEVKRFFPSRARVLGETLSNSVLDNARTFSPVRLLGAAIGGTGSYLFSPNIPTSEAEKVPTGTVRGAITAPALTPMVPGEYGELGIGKRAPPAPPGTKAASAAAAKKQVAALAPELLGDPFGGASKVALPPQDPIAEGSRYAEGIAGLMKKERDELTAAEKKQIDAYAAKEGKAKDTAGYIAALKMSGALAKPGQARGLLGLTGADAALGIAGEEAGSYEKGRQGREEKQQAAELASLGRVAKQREGDLGLGLTMQQQQAVQAIDRKYKEGIISKEMAELEIKKYIAPAQVKYLESQIAENLAKVRYLGQVGAAAGATGKQAALQQRYAATVMQLQNKIESTLADDIQFKSMPEAQKQVQRQIMLQKAIAANPFLKDYMDTQGLGGGITGGGPGLIADVGGGRVVGSY